MRSIGVRELRQHASRYLRRVEAGETIEVTDRGRPVALLAPIPRSSQWDRLVAAGRLRPLEGRLEDLGPPLAPRAGAPLPSEVLAALRADER
jgi:prevent-host-death family protein